MLDLEQLIILVSASIIIAVLGSAIYLRKTGPKRRMASGNQQAVLDHYNVLMTINEDQKAVILSCKGKIQQLMRKVSELEGFEEEEQAPQINITQLKPIATALGINDAQLEGILNDPKAKKWLNKGENLQLLQIALPFIQSKLTQGGSNPLDQGAVQSGNLQA